MTTALGIGLGQLIMLIGTGFLVRIYSPKDFGIYAISFAVAGILATVAALRLDLAIVAADSNDAQSLLFFAWLLPFITVPLAGFALVFLADVLGQYPPSADTKLLLLTAAAAIMQSIVLTGLSFFARFGFFRGSALIRSLQPLFFVLSALFWEKDLIFAMTLSWLLALLLMIFIIVGQINASNPLNHREIWRKYGKIPMTLTPGTLLDALTLALPLIFIGMAFGDEAAGQYSQVQRLVGAPLMLVAMAIAPVFMKHGGDAFRGDGSITRVLLQTVALLACGGLLLTLAVWAMGSALLGALMGQEWRTDTAFVMLCLMPIVARACVSPVSGIFAIVSRLKLGVIWQVTYFVTTITLLYISYYHFNLNEMLLAYFVHETILYALYLAFALRVAKGMDLDRGVAPTKRMAG